MEPNNPTSLLDDVTDSDFRYGETLVIVSMSAGYSVDRTPRDVAINM